ncbi:hypothetical protein L195_g033738 [Trifolium pratense]|uniref:Pectin acetylesterase n=1 Tax=Trifolium pratense TaxID=57577 RepID=A0A2K3LGU7_TRIPR|nr:hypothetical protein L195_g033738 [Trifolium pratense]
MKILFMYRNLLVDFSFISLDLAYGYVGLNGKDHVVIDKRVVDDFFNWNRVKIRYYDGASFTGDSEDRAAQLQFRGQHIWLAAIEDLMSKGMRFAKQFLYHITIKNEYEKEQIGNR